MGVRAARQRDGQLLAEELILPVGRQGSGQAVPYRTWEAAAGQARGAVPLWAGRAAEGVVPLWAGRGGPTQTRGNRLHAGMRLQPGSQSHRTEPFVRKAWRGRL